MKMGISCKRMVEHIDKQDYLKPLSDVTIEQKGHDKIYVETGWLKKPISKAYNDKALRSTIFVSVLGNAQAKERNL